VVCCLLSAGSVTLGHVLTCFPLPTHLWPRPPLGRRPTTARSSERASCMEISSQELPWLCIEKSMKSIIILSIRGTSIPNNQKSINLIKLSLLIYDKIICNWNKIFMYETVEVQLNLWHCFRLASGRAVAWGISGRLSCFLAELPSLILSVFL
jgi:hypothetical protein